MPIKPINSVPNFLFETPKKSIRKNNTNTNINIKVIPLNNKNIFHRLQSILYCKTN
jgi:hypothetical protein